MAAPRQGMTHLEPSTAFEQSNIALLGSDIDHHLRADSAHHEPAFVAPGVGTQAGVWSWRVEAFKLVEWRTGDKLGTGDFLDGDSYLLLQSSAPTPKTLVHEIHFWLGRNTSTDEAGVAAYKAVELDELLGGHPIQHRQVQGSESSQFLSLFHPHFLVCKGGHASGFHHVLPSTAASLHLAQPRLWEVFLVPSARKGSYKHKKVQEVTANIEGIHQDCVYILDLGDQLLQWSGEESHAAKAAAAEIARAWCDEREGKSKLEVFEQGSGDSAFFSALGVLPGAIPSSFPKRHATALSPPSTPPKILDLLSTPPTTLPFEAISSLKNHPPSQLILVSTFRTHFVWIGTELPRDEKRSAMTVAQKAISSGDVSDDVSSSHTIVRVVQGGEGEEFWREIEV